MPTLLPKPPVAIEGLPKLASTALPISTREIPHTLHTFNKYDNYERLLRE